MKSTIGNIILGLILLVNMSFSTNDIYPPSEFELPAQWTEYKVFDGVQVEYKLEQCTDGVNNNEVWVVFRFTNTTSESKELNWVSKWNRGDDCVNCDRLDSYEFSHKLPLASKEVLAGEACVNKDQRFFMFSHFVQVYPGMDDKKLTGFEFIKVEVKEN